MKRPKRLIILIVILCATIGFIWIHSMMPQSVSSDESNAVMDFIKPFLEIFVGKGNVTQHLVRKLAHFTEYTALGVELGLLFSRIKKRFVWKNYPLILVHAVCVAFIDETIQIFSGRGPAVSDMWIDVSGAALGSAAVLLIVMIIRRTEKNKREE